MDSCEDPSQVSIDARMHLFLCLLELRGPCAGWAFFEFHVDVGGCPRSPGLCVICGYPNRCKVAYYFVDAEARFVAESLHAVELLGAIGCDGDTQLGDHLLVFLWHAEQRCRVAQEYVSKRPAHGIASGTRKAAEHCSSAFNMRRLEPFAYAGDAEEFELTLGMGVVLHGLEPSLPIVEALVWHRLLWPACDFAPILALLAPFG